MIMCQRSKNKVEKYTCVCPFRQPFTVTPQNHYYGQNFCDGKRNYDIGRIIIAFKKAFYHFGIEKIHRCRVEYNRTKKCSCNPIGDFLCFHRPLVKALFDNTHKTIGIFIFIKPIIIVWFYLVFYKTLGFFVACFGIYL